MLSLQRVCTSMDSHIFLVAQERAAASRGRAQWVIFACCILLPFCCPHSPFVSALCSGPCNSSRAWRPPKGRFFQDTATYPNLMWKVSFSCVLLSRCHYATVAHGILVVGGAYSLDDLFYDPRYLCVRLTLRNWCLLIYLKVIYLCKSWGRCHSDIANICHKM